MFNDNSYNDSGYNDDLSIASAGGVIKYVAFPKRIGTANRKMHVHISDDVENIFPNQQVVVLPPPPPPVAIAIGNPIGLLLAFTYSKDGTLPIIPVIIPPAPVVPVVGNPLGLLLTLTLSAGSLITTGITTQDGNFLTTQDGNALVYF